MHHIQKTILSNSVHIAAHFIPLYLSLTFYFILINVFQMCKLNIGFILL